MSKITPKNLQYNSDLPPFLQRLHTNNTSGDGRHEFSIARPKRARNAEDEAEDEPVYFDETTNHSMSKVEYEALAAEEDKVSQEAGETRGKNGELKTETIVDLGKVEKEKERLAAIGRNKKRKAGKAIGVEVDQDEEERGADKASKSQRKEAEKGKVRKKGKKIKLSFGDDE